MIQVGNTESALIPGQQPVGLARVRTAQLTPSELVAADREAPRCLLLLHLALWDPLNELQLESKARAFVARITVLFQVRAQEFLSDANRDYFRKVVARYMRLNVLDDSNSVSLGRSMSAYVGARMTQSPGPVS
jgi:hypothetical protein